MGMIGGGKDAFIGAIHRIAANTDGLIELVCGALSIDKNIAVDSGRLLFLPEDRIYTTFEEMLKKATPCSIPGFILFGYAMSSTIAICCCELQSINGFS